jgi:hypothetical protein
MLLLTVQHIDKGLGTLKTGRIFNTNILRLELDPDVRLGLNLAYQLPMPCALCMISLLC